MQSSDSKMDSLGIYVHIPFCQKKCRYCDFFSTTDLKLIPDYLAGLQKEIQLAGSSETRADSLYIGGGTPSLLTPRQIGQIVDWVALRFDLDPAAEITLEINPATATARDLADYAAFGLNRLNIGVQSFNDSNLSFLGRIHNASQALTAVKAAQDAGFNNIGLDLIYGLPEQTPSTWKKDLIQAIRLLPKHLSCYILTYEPHTPLYADQQAGRIVPLSDLRTADLFRTTHDFLSAGGYEHYEISNFANGDRWRSRHNQKYWNFAPYIGLGPAAHSCRIPHRWWNHRSLLNYLAALNQEQLPKSEEETLTTSQQMIEAIYLGLRQADGIDLITFENRFKIDFKLYFGPSLQRFSAEGWVHIDDQRCCLTVEGMLFLDHIVDQLVELID